MCVNIYLWLMWVYLLRVIYIKGVICHILFATFFLWIYLENLSISGSGWWGQYQITIVGCLVLILVFLIIVCSIIWYCYIWIPSKVSQSGEQDWILSNMVSGASLVPCVCGVIPGHFIFKKKSVSQLPNGKSSIYNSDCSIWVGVLGWGAVTGIMDWIVLPHNSCVEALTPMWLFLEIGSLGGISS